MHDWPRMLYRKGGPKSLLLHDFNVDIRIVDGADEEAAAKREGWQRTPAGAYGETPELQDEIEGLTQENEELEERVKELEEDIAPFDADKDGRIGGSAPRRKLTIKG